MRAMLLSCVGLLLFMTTNGQTLAPDAQTLTPEERKFVIGMLEENSRIFLQSIENVTITQWDYKPPDGGWSVAEVAEHITLAEEFLRSVAQRSLKTPADQKRSSALAGKENAVIERMKDRTQKNKAPEKLIPTHTFASKKELIAAFKITREKTIHYVDTNQDQLKSHIVAHSSFGDLTAYQWLVLIPAHANRHVAQLIEVKELNTFPAD